jgi:hypothetical protein
MLELALENDPLLFGHAFTERGEHQTVTPSLATPEMLRRSD